MADYKAMPTLIEEKVRDILQVATIDDVSDYKVVGIDWLLLDWDNFDEYPRLVIYCNDDNEADEQVSTRSMPNKTYTVNIMVLCYNADYSRVIVQRDTVLGRIRAALRADKRLSNLADNTTNEKVWNSYIRRTRYSKSGLNGSYQVLSWLEFKVETSII